MDQTLFGRAGPISYLPPEILEEIFIESLPAFPTISLKVAPLLLCSICSPWRKLALSSTRLWSNISINLSSLVPGSWSRPEDGCNRHSMCAIEFLRRAKSRLLSIKLEASLPAVFENVESATHFECFLHRFHGRIQNLEISSSWLSRLLYSISPEISFPQLLSVIIKSPTGTRFDALSTPLPIFADSALLKSFTCNAYLSQDTVFNLAVPWSQLTHLTLTNIDYTPWAYVFKRCTNLQSGTFVVCGRPQPSPKSADFIFPSLTQLSIHSNQSSRSLLSLEGYCFPNLKDLRLGWNHSPGFNTNFLSTIRNLECLSISCSQCHLIDFGEMLSILSLTPSITELSVADDNCSSELFDALTYHKHHQRPLLPLLRSLLVDTSKWSSMCDRNQVFDRISRMVGSRWWVCPNSKVSRLETLEVAIAENDMERIQNALKLLKGDGFVLKLSLVREGEGS